MNDSFMIYSKRDYRMPKARPSFTSLFFENNLLKGNADKCHFLVITRQEDKK